MNYASFLVLIGLGFATASGIRLNCPMRGETRHETGCVEAGDNCHRCCSRSLDTTAFASNTTPTAKQKNAAKMNPVTPTIPINTPQLLSATNPNCTPAPPAKNSFATRAKAAINRKHSAPPLRQSIDRTISRLSYQNCAPTQNVFIWKLPLLVDWNLKKIG